MAKFSDYDIVVYDGIISIYSLFKDLFGDKINELPMRRAYAEEAVRYVTRREA